jgi:hypothetical protein
MDIGFRDGGTLAVCAGRWSGSIAAGYSTGTLTADMRGIAGSLLPECLQRRTASPNPKRPFFLRDWPCFSKAELCVELAARGRMGMGEQERPFPFNWNERFFKKDRN